MTTPSDLDKLSAEARQGIGALRSRVIRRANGALPYDYIVPSGVYEEQWDWDAFFVGLHLISVDRADVIYLKNWCLNFLGQKILDTHYSNSK
jgi:neutral trehalase